MDSVEAVGALLSQFHPIAALGGILSGGLLGEIVAGQFEHGFDLLHESIGAGRLDGFELVVDIGLSWSE